MVADFPSEASPHKEPSGNPPQAQLQPEESGAIDVHLWQCEITAHSFNPRRYWPTPSTLRLQWGVIERPRNTLAWKHLEWKKNKLEQQKRTRFLLLLVIIFLDDFEQYQSRRKKVGGLYLTLANLPVDLLTSTRWWGAKLRWSRAPWF